MGCNRDITFPGRRNRDKSWVDLTEKSMDDVSSPKTGLELFELFGLF